MRLCTFLLSLSVATAGPVGAQGQTDASEEQYASYAASTHDGLDVPGATWVDHPSTPGPDRPPVGRSLFDRLFASTAGGTPRYDIPFPISVLLARIESRLVPGDGPALREIKIPLGRSLQRRAAAPDYFRFPRLVVVADGEPRAGRRDAGLVLRKRFFLGYQERANAIEVISYNDEAGRFEFQVVTDYGPGMTPKVGYASRVLCMSCHQNAGPIFPKIPWTETDANLHIAQRIHLARPDTYRGPLPLYSRTSRFAWFVDYATDFANYFSSYQLLWEKGCGDGGWDLARAARCRAAILVAALQYRLSESLYFDDGSPRYLHDYEATVSENWARLWPKGLKIPTADLADRDPFTQPDIDPLLDPLTPRAPRAYWSAPKSGILIGSPSRLAEFLSRDDVSRLDAHLRAQAMALDLPRRRLVASCDIELSWVGDRRQRLFSCPSAADAGHGNLQVEGRLLSAHGELLQGSFAELNLDRSAKLRPVRLTGARIARGYRESHLAAAPTAGEQGFRARLADGRLVERLQLRWPSRPGFVDTSTQANRVRGEIIVDLVDDFALVEAAVDRMVAATIAGRTDSLSAKPFQRRSVIPALERELGMTPRAWCCDEAAALPPIELLSSLVVAAMPESSELMEPFYLHCAACHRTEQSFPPAFLRGDAERVLSSLRDCAPRILYRLSMWQHPADRRALSPMPPVHRVQGIDYGADWALGPDWERLDQVARQLLAARGDPNPDQVLASTYSSLPACTVSP